MPGLFGVVTSQPRAWAERQLRMMAATVCHERFYVTGTHVCEELGVYVGWSAHEGSSGERMPLDRWEGLSICFSGEDFRAPDATGPACDGARCTYLLDLYESGADFPAQLNGMFHGIVVDRVRRKAMIFNDRYGMHRLYYYECGDAFYFAAEAKTILAVCPELRTADPQGLAEFISFSCVLENRTFFAGLKVLPAGSAWVVRNGVIEQKGAYFQPSEWESLEALDPDAYYDELKSVLSRSAPRYLSGAQKVGMTLTGGLDTRVLMALGAPPKGTIPCYTFGGMFRESQDVRIARSVAKISGQSHEVIEVGKEFLSQFSRYAERTVYLTEGCTDVYRSPDLYVSERARNIAPVKVVGTYGSEILGHAVMFRPVHLTAGLLAPEMDPLLGRAAATYASVLDAHPVTFSAFRQSPWWHFGVLALEKSQLNVRSPYMDNDFVRTVYRAPMLNGSGDDVRLRLIRDGSRALSAFQTDRGIGGDSNSLLRRIHRGYLEFTFKAEWAYDYGMPQWLAALDHAFAPLHLERLYAGRHKLTHFRVWYRDYLGSYVREMLLDDRSLARPYLQRRTVETVVEGHLKGNRNYTTELHKLLTLELLHRLFIDK